MYNGMGLKTPRGSGTSGYTQANKFSVKPKGSSVKKRLEGDDDDDVHGLKKVIINKEMIEHERKRQIQVKLVMLEDQLIDHGYYTDDEISQKVDEARKVLEEEEESAAAASAKEIDHEGRGIVQNKWN